MFEKEAVGSLSLQSKQLPGCSSDKRAQRDLMIIIIISPRSTIHRSPEGTLHSKRQLRIYIHQHSNGACAVRIPPSAALSMRIGVHAPTPPQRVPGIMAEPEVSSQAVRTPQTIGSSAAAVAAVTAPPVAGSGGAVGSSSTSTSSDPVRPGLSQQQRASQRKAHARSFPRAKKLEKLGVFSACKVRGRERDKRAREASRCLVQLSLPPFQDTKGCWKVASCIVCNIPALGQ